ncbi:MAG: DUF2330 domain-containing protein [Labilithrix sp.]|nr:DUF2330 domain-containing protein [Labilithrix sp.]MCW5810094.1 DUF2330 domain-containing protein [Labilithrix sp.]
MRFTTLALGTFFAGALAVTDVRDAVACGGCFHPATPIVSGTETTSVVTDHRMVFKVSTNETILWDQVRYTGAPEEFAWVLPVREGARIELSRDEFIGALEAATRTTVRGPVRTCRTANGGTRTVGGDDSGGGCGGSDDSATLDSARAGGDDGDTVDAGAAEESDGVEIVAEAVIGPYQSVTLRSKNGEGISEWLTKNGFAIPDNVKPTVDAYTREGFDFIALRLRPGQGVQAMRPVRVVTPGSDATLPLRMVAAGVGARVGLTLWIIAEGRYQAQSFPNAVVDRSKLVWNGKTGRSNLTDLQRTALATNDGRTWLTETSDRQSFERNVIVLGDDTSSVHTLYTQQCITRPPRVRPCDEDKLPGPGAQDADGGAGGASDAGACTELVSGCDGWDDLEVARRGLHEGDIWLTRMRADLPVAALSTDLRLEAGGQTPISARHQANVFSDPNDEPCPDGVLRSNNTAPPPNIPPDDDSACTCRTTRPLHKQAGTWLLIAATTFAAARIARQRKR